MALSLRQLKELKDVFQRVIELDANPHNIMAMFLRHPAQVTDAQLEIAVAYQKGLLVSDVRQQIDAAVAELLRGDYL